MAGNRKTSTTIGAALCSVLLAWPALSPPPAHGAKRSPPAWRPPHRGQPAWTIKEFEIGPGQSTEMVFDVFETTVVYVTACYNARARPRKKPWAARPVWGSERRGDPRPYELSLIGPHGEALRTLRGDLPLRIRYRAPKRVFSAGERWRAKLFNRGTGGWAWGSLRIAYQELPSYKWYDAPEAQRRREKAKSRRRRRRR